MIRQPEGRWRTYRPDGTEIVVLGIDQPAAASAGSQAAKAG